MLFITKSTKFLEVLHKLSLIHIFDVVRKCEFGVCTVRVGAERAEMTVQCYWFDLKKSSECKVCEKKY